MTDAYLRQRGDDVQEVGRALLRALSSPATAWPAYGADGGDPVRR